MPPEVSLSDFPYLHALPIEIAEQLTEEVGKSCPDCGQQMVATVLSGGNELFEGNERLYFKCGDCSVSTSVREIPGWVPVTDLISSDDGETTTLGEFAEA